MTNKEEHSNKRHFSRVPFDTLVYMTIREHQYSCKLIDISLKGVMVDLEEDIEVGLDDICHIEISLRSFIRIKMEGTIAHINGKHIGLQLKDIDLDSMVHLRRLVELNLGDPDTVNHEIVELATKGKR